MRCVLSGIYRQSKGGSEVCHRTLCILSFEVTAALQASWPANTLGRAQHLNMPLGAKASDSFMMVDLMHGLMKMLPHEQGIMDLIHVCS